MKQNQRQKMRDHATSLTEQGVCERVKGKSWVTKMLPHFKICQHTQSERASFFFWQLIPHLRTHI